MIALKFRCKNMLVLSVIYTSILRSQTYISYIDYRLSDSSYSTLYRVFTSTVMFYGMMIAWHV